jgi:hypothetical protein
LLGGGRSLKNKLKFFLKCTIIIIAVSMTTGCNPDLGNNKPKSSEDIVKEVTSPKVNYLTKLEEGHEVLTFESNYSITSKFEDFGEEVTFIPDKSSGDLIVAIGSYSSGVKFYRIYNMAYDKKQIVYEVTNEWKEAYEEFEKSENVFSYKNEKPTTLLEKPYEVGHSWDDGKITSIYEVDGEYFIEVTYINHNKIIFSDKRGVKEIHYTLPPELKGIYAGITEDVIVGK